jgi:hypothetical protein
MSPNSTSETCSSSDFSGFHLPPVVTTRIYPYTSFADNSINFRQRRNSRSGAISTTTTTTSCSSTYGGIVGAVFWFALGSFISIFVMFIATQTLWWESPLMKSNEIQQQTTSIDKNDSMNRSNHQIKNNTEADSNGEKCFDEMCMKAAARILHRMNHSVEPCDDFYQFSCGNQFSFSSTFINIGNLR